MQLAAGVAHNFNNVLMATMGNAQAAQELMVDPLTNVNHVEKLLNNVAQAARGGQEVVQRLTQAVSFQRAGREQDQVVDAGQLLRSLPATLRGMRPSDGQGSITVRLDLQPGLFVRATAGGLAVAGGSGRQRPGLCPCECSWWRTRGWWPWACVSQFSKASTVARGAISLWP